MKNTTKKEKSIFKKVLKWVSITFLVLLIALISIPFLFKDKIKTILENSINQNVNAQVTFNKVDLSLLKSFPLANLTIDKVTVINKEPFLGDTLFFGKEVHLKMSILELFKSTDETMNLQSFSAYNSKLNILFNKKGQGNYDIAKESKNNTDTKESKPFSLNIQEYTINNLDFSYKDEASKMNVFLDSIIHSGNGNFAEEILDLTTKSTALLSLEMDDINYINNVFISLDAILGINLKETKFTFKENTGFVNQLPLEFSGFLQLVNEHQLYDINFKTPTSSFKNLLALVPKQFAGNLKTIKTSGDFSVNGIVKGILSDDSIPNFDISFLSKNAMFKYADLPKAVQKINIDAKIINKTGNANDIFVDINKLSFKIDEDEFSANGNIRNLSINPKIKINANGTINLANLSKVYPVALETELAGVLKANVATSLDLNSIEQKKYENIKNTGTISLTNFKYEDKQVANPFFIDKTILKFNPNTIQLVEFSAKTGTSDLKINGNLDNFYGFLFKNQELKGDFTLNAYNLKVDDFLSKEESETTDKTGSLKIPAFLNCTFNATAKKVVYDNLNLTNVSGKLFVKNETLDLQNLQLDIFGGKIGMNGKVSTKEKISNFSMDLNLAQLNISESFSQLEMLKSIAPIAKTIEGKINSTINVAGNLNDDMTPDLKTISGQLLGQLLNTKLKASNSKVLNIVDSKVDFIDIDKLNLNEASALLSFKNGEVNVKPFNINYKDIGINIGGKHGFDNAMNYDITFDVPVKYLGSEVTSILSKLSPKDAANIKSIPVKANLTGSFSSPNLSTDIKEATATLVKDLVEKQKQSLVNKGKDKLTNLLGIDKKDTLKTKEVVKDKIKGALSNLFKKKKKDTVN